MPASEKYHKEELIQKIKDALILKPEIQFAYLFGSVAKGTANKLSDIDLALYIDDNYEHRSPGYGYQCELITELSELLNAKVDLVILNKSSTILRHQVIKNGVLLFSRSNEQRRAFHEKTMRDYLDFKPFLKVQHQYLKQRILNGSFGGNHDG